MCGGSLLATPPAKPAESQPVSVAASPTATRVAAEPAQEPPRSLGEGSTSISGPSFLGLNDPTPGRQAPRKRASLSIDPHSAPGSNLDYLLDEEEPRHHWGIGKILLILIAFGLAAGFGYLRFKNQGLAWLNPSKKPSAAQNSTPPDTTTTPPPSPSSPLDSQPSPQPSTAAPPQPTTAAPSNPPGASSAGTSAPAAPAPSTPAPSDSAKQNEAPPDGTSDKAAAPADSDKTAAPTDKDSPPAKDTTPDNPPAATKPVEKPKPAPKAPAPKPSAAGRPVAAYDSVAEAQKYLYGRGAPQDCDRGLRLLRPAANQAQPKAMIEMGALYSAGLCTPHDLPTAYRWFAMALRKDPENTAVQADLQKLWGEMTQPERQLAIKLTQ